MKTFILIILALLILFVVLVSLILVFAIYCRGIMVNDLGSNSFVLSDDSDDLFN